MGLFDYIRCEMPLPDGAPHPATEWFQTKDTPDQYMSRYTILEDGRLQYRNVLEVRGLDETKTGINQIIGSLTPTKTENIMLEDYHGDVEFHEYKTKTREWWSYIARFTNGKCEAIKLGEYERRSR